MGGLRQRLQSKVKENIFRVAFYNRIDNSDGMMTELIKKDNRQLLCDAGLRPTRQRVSLADLLFDQCDRHVTAEELHEEALHQGVPVSLATVYNTLHQLTGAGLLREVAVAGSKSYFDTNTSNHCHFYSNITGELEDIPAGAIDIQSLPEPPKGTEISRVDVLVHLVEKAEG